MERHYSGLPCGADFVPPPPEEVDRLLLDLCATVNDDLSSPLVQAALVHAQFETIHPFADATAWEVIKTLPAHPMITVSVAAAATGRSKPSTYQTFEQLVRAGVLVSLSAGRRNQSWEAAGLFELIAELEDGGRGASVDNQV